MGRLNQYPRPPVEQRDAAGLDQLALAEKALAEGRRLEIFTYPAPILKKKAAPVETFDAELKALCLNMLHTMYHAPGIGLAAPQVGISRRLFVMDIAFEREEAIAPDGSESYTLSNFGPRILINPVLRDFEGEQLFREGCLSVPEVYEEVKRAERICVDYQDVEGRAHTLEADGLLAVCLQHENDHLDGIVFLERLSPLKRDFLAKKFFKKKK